MVKLSMIKLTPQELAAGRNVMKQCLGVKPGEKVLIVTDPGKQAEAQIFFQTATEFTDQAELAIFPGTKANGQEPPAEITQKMLSCDVAFLVTTYSLSHTKARKNAGSAGSRIASMPGITREIISRTLNADYSQIAELSRQLADRLSGAKTARLTSPGGTDLTFSLAGRKGDADTGIYTQPGQWGNLPAGEACIGPLENLTQGKLIIDGSVGEIRLDRPIEIIIKNGFAVSISGGQAAQTLKQQLTQAGPLANQVAELGIGTNSLATISANVLEAEKAYGTCHVALGNNLSYGGIVDVPIHEDGVILKPTLWIDDKMILKSGKFLI